MLNRIAQAPVFFLAVAIFAARGVEEARAIDVCFGVYTWRHRGARVALPPRLGHALSEPRHERMRPPTRRGSLERRVAVLSHLLPQAPQFEVPPLGVTVLSQVA